MAAAGLVVVLVGLGLGWWSGAGPTAVAAPTRPLAATAALDPGEVFFGDPVHATVTVVVDRHVVAPASVRVEPGFAPYAPAGAPTVTRTTTGAAETIRYGYTLTCVDDGCLPVKSPLSLRFPDVHVAALAGTERLTANAAWPTLSISTRLQAGATAAGTPKFEGPAALPPPAYAVSPSLLADLLTAASGLLSLAALALLAREAVAFAARRRRTASLRLTPLERALAKARQAAGRPSEADRRKALNLLAETLAAQGDDTLAASTGAAAWAEEPPQPQGVLAVVDEVEARTRVEA